MTDIFKSLRIGSLIRDAESTAKRRDTQSRLPVPSCRCGRRIQPFICPKCSAIYCESCAGYNHGECK